MAQEDIELMTDTVLELDLPLSELRLFTLRLPEYVNKAFINVMRTRHQIEIFT